MVRALTMAALPVLAMLAACGNGNRGDAGDIVTTNTGDVVLNDAQSNYAFRGDNETVANQAAPADAMTVNAAAADPAMGNADGGNSAVSNSR